VTWTNRDEAPHSVSSEDGTLTSTGLVTDETFSYTFEEPGTYEYFSQYFPDARGTVIVTEP
jgi:plastocyanin